MLDTQQYGTNFKLENQLKTQLLDHFGRNPQQVAARFTQSLQ